MAGGGGERGFAHEHYRNRYVRIAGGRRDRSGASVGELFRGTVLIASRLACTILLLLLLVAFLRIASERLEILGNLLGRLLSVLLDLVRSFSDSFARSRLVIVPTCIVRIASDEECQGKCDYKNLHAVT